MTRYGFTLGLPFLSAIQPFVVCANGITGYLGENWVKLLFVISPNRPTIAQTVNVVQREPTNREGTDSTNSVICNRTLDPKEVNKISSLGMLSQGEGKIWYQTITKPVLRSIPVNSVLGPSRGGVINPWAIANKLLGKENYTNSGMTIEHSSAEYILLATGSAYFRHHRRSRDGDDEKSVCYHYKDCHPFEPMGNFNYDKAKGIRDDRMHVS